MKLALLLLAACVGCSGHESIAQVKPPPQPVRWIVVSPPLVPGITFVGTAPVLGNAGTCDAPRFVPISGVVTMRWAWTGAAPGTGVLMAAVGDTFRLTVPADAESLRVWAERGGVSGCDTTLAVTR